MKGVLDAAKHKGIVLTMKRMLEIIPGYARLNHLVKAAEYFEGKRDTSQTNIQINLGEAVSQARNERGL